MKKGIFALMAAWLVFDVLSRWTFLGGFLFGLVVGGLGVYLLS